MLPKFSLNAEASAAELTRQPSSLPDEGPLPDLAALVRTESTAWLDSPPLNPASLRGKVVLVDFWTYSCINSLRNLPYLQAWAEKYKEAGLVVIGVHSPEFSFEKDRSNVERAVREYHVRYPVAIDSEYRIWDAFSNEYWPADYVVDGNGRIRHHHFGEGDYAETERVIQELLRGNGATSLGGPVGRVTGRGIETPPSDAIGSPETYVGYRRSESFASTERTARDAPHEYALPAELALNRWALGGVWTVGPESGRLVSPGGRLAFRFHSRDLHLVLGPGSNGGPVRFKLTLDGKPPGKDHGIDSSPDGTGTVRASRLYQLVRQKGSVADRTFEIEFLDSGVLAYVFTFG
jgi:thiol-disulfide isomerase/thioredoxin